LSYVQFSLEQTAQEVSLFRKQLQLVHKPLQVTTSIQTFLGYNEYANLSRLSWVHSRLKETHSKERAMKAHKVLLHNGEELHNGFTQLKNLNALNSILTVDT